MVMWLFLFQKVPLITAHVGFWVMLYSLEIQRKDWISHRNYFGLVDFFWQNYVKAEQFQSLEVS